MISSWLSMCMFYLFSLLTFYSCNSLISVWILMELNLIMFLLLMFFLEGSESEIYFKVSMYYFLMQSFGSMFFLFFVVENNEGGLMPDLILFLSMSLKMGLFPFVFWVFVIVPVMGSLSMFFFLVFQKVCYFLVFFSLAPLMSMKMCFFSMALGTMLMFVNSELDKFLVSSSLSSSFWVFFLYTESLSSFIGFYVFYGLVLFPLLSRKNMWRGISIYKKFNFWIMSMAFLFLVGLPPFSLFFFKLDVVNLMVQGSKDLDFIWFWLFSFLSLLGYFKMFFKNFVFSHSLLGSLSSLKFIGFIFPMVLIPVFLL